MIYWDSGDERDSKRSLGIRDKQILYRNAKGRCQNPGCGKKIDFDEMEIGHKTAWSRGGITTFRNSVCLCHRCNKLQGTDSWAVFMKKQNIKDPKTELKESLKNLTLQELKLLAAKHKVRVAGYVEEDLFSSRRVAPTKSQYITKLSKVVTDSDLRSRPKPPPKPKRRARRKSDSWW
ncbi:MAG: HNH endonuclease signature motif containing protein [Dehalococcoidales bacterium]|nr:HNH endonuclease signature motif containing protein [Dehalococcoidales bacterium]